MRGGPAGWMDGWPDGGRIEVSRPRPAALIESIIPRGLPDRFSKYMYPPAAGERAVSSSPATHESQANLAIFLTTRM